MTRIAAPLNLSAQDIEELTSMSHANKVDHRYVMRSRIILKLHEGKSYDQVQQELSVGREAVAKWKKRFIALGISGLKDKPGRGVKPTYTDADKARIVQKACQKPEGGYTNWSQRRIAKELGMSQGTLGVPIVFGRNVSLDVYPKMGFPHFSRQVIKQPQQ
ncbi:MAG: helix-turn-helix domain-containing protein [Cyclobacteriaceae bacterium]